jgi:tetratricopeptide (TPR) repeat protein
MNTTFIDILQKLIAEQGKEALLNSAKCKAFLADYTKGEYKKESRLLLQALEAGVQKAIDTTGELEICKQQQIRVLQEEHFLTAEAAADVVETLIVVLKGEQGKGASHGALCANCGKELQKEWKTCPYCSTPAAQATGSAAKARYEKGERFLDNEDYDAAIAEFTEAIRLNPNFTNAYNKRGSAYSYKGQYDAVIRDFTEAIRLDPNCAFAYANRGLTYSFKGQYDKAIEDYTELIRLDPNTAFSYESRGRAYLNKDQYDKAIKDFAEAIRLEPNYADAYEGRGRAYFNKDQYDKAIKDFSEAIRLEPNDASAYEGRAFIYAEKDQYDKAINDCTELIRLKPNDAHAYHYRGLMYWKLDDNKAIKDLEKALSLDPTNDNVEEFLQKIRGY